MRAGGVSLVTLKGSKRACAGLPRFERCGGKWRGTRTPCSRAVVQDQPPSRVASMSAVAPLPRASTEAAVVVADAQSSQVPPKWARAHQHAHMSAAGGVHAEHVRGDNRLVAYLHEWAGTTSALVVSRAGG